MSSPGRPCLRRPVPCHHHIKTHNRVSREPKRGARRRPTSRPTCSPPALAGPSGCGCSGWCGTPASPPSPAARRCTSTTSSATRCGRRRVRGRLRPRAVPGRGPRLPRPAV